MSAPGRGELDVLQARAEAFKRKQQASQVLSLTHSLARYLSLTHTNSLSHTHTNSLSLTHTHTRSFSLSLSLTHTHSLSHSRILSHTHTHTLTLSLSLSLSQSLSLSLSLSLSRGAGSPAGPASERGGNSLKGYVHTYIYCISYTYVPQVDTGVTKLRLVGVDRLRVGWHHESRRCSRVTNQESYITKYTSIRRESRDG